MRGQTQSQSIGELTSYQESHKESLQKTKLINKHKADFTHSLQKDDTAHKLSKDEKARIQKQKNREAAQRSRDTHKDYVTNLQQEVKVLRQKVEHSKLYCYRCRQLLDIQQTIAENKEQLFCFEEESLVSAKEAVAETNVTQQTVEPDSFLRWLQPQEDHSFLKMMLLVCMVVIAVIIMGSGSATSSASRTLMEKYQQSPVLYENGMNVISAGQSCVQQKALVQPHKAISSQECLDSLMRIQTPSGRKSLRNLHDSTYSEQMESIMLCSLRTPRIYGAASSQLTGNPSFKLLLSGADIKRMAQSSKAVLSLTDRNIQLNGIYRLGAEIKSVELISHHSCLI